MTGTEGSTRTRRSPASPHNIAGIQALHHSAGAILRPFCNLPDSTFPLRDLVTYDIVAQRGRELTNYGYISVLNDFTGNKDEARYGVQLDWGYLHVGVLTFTTEQWRYAGNIGPTDPWREPTAEEQMARILYHASTTPLVRVSEVKVASAGPVYTISATVANEGFLPTNMTEQAIRARIAKPVVAEIELAPGMTLGGGAAKVTLGHIDGTPAVVKEYSFGSQTFSGSNKRNVEWVVSGTGQVTIRAISEKGGKHARTVTIGGPAQ